jgi:hypothetical protein
MEHPSQFHLQLSRLAGQFVGTETHYPMPGFAQLQHAEARVSGQLELNGLFLVRHYETRRGSDIIYKGHGVYTWDQDRHAYAVYWFDTAGTCPVAPAFGNWTDDALEFGTSGALRIFVCCTNSRQITNICFPSRNYWIPRTGSRHYPGSTRA